MKKIVMIGPCPSKRGEIEPRKSVDRPESPKESRKMRMIKRVGVEKTVPGKEERKRRNGNRRFILGTFSFSVIA
mgnify:CR=1 FL=1